MDSRRRIERRRTAWLHGVVVMLVAGATNIRDVIAFPKTNTAASPMDGCPSAVDDRQLRDLGLRLR